MSAESLQAITNPWLNVKQVSAKVGMSVATIYRRMAEDEFPRGVRLSKGCVRWAMDDIEAWLQDRKAQIV